MENIVAARMQIVRSAPYADTAIPLFLTSITGMRYRTLNCMECGHEFLERNNDMMYRLNDEDLPAEIPITSASVKAKCGNCQQWYGVQVSVSVNIAVDSVPLYMQPQSIYIAVDTTKKLRYLHCLECGKPFHSISDRITQMIDNRVPFEYLSPNRLGPMEAMCSSDNCKQTWALML